MDELGGTFQERFLRTDGSSLINPGFLVEVRNPPAVGQAIMQDGSILNVSRARMEDLLNRAAQMS